MQSPTLPIASFNYTSRSFTCRQDAGSLYTNNLKVGGTGRVRIPSALPETLASIAVAATVVGAAAAFLVKRNKSAEAIEAPSKTCEDCGGSGVCAECKGEGFVVKRLSEENAQRARLMSSNAATRYTAGLPKKWSYCTKCSSARSCNTCGGSGKLAY